MLRCPTCKKPVAPRLENAFFPFCSERCKLVDLGKWFSEEYRVVGKADEVEDELPGGVKADDDGSP